MALANTAGSGALPIVNYTTGNQQVQQQDAGAQNQMNVYNQGQLGLQGMSNGYAAGLLSGQVPEGMGMSDATRQKAWLDWNSQVAPRLAQQNGAGSPAIGSSASQLALGLASQDSQMGFANSLGAFQAASNMAYKPIGVDQANMNNRNVNQANESTSTTQDYGALASMLAQLGLSMGGGSGGATSPTFPSTSNTTGSIFDWAGQ